MKDGRKKERDIIFTHNLELYNLTRRKYTESDKKEKPKCCNILFQTSSINCLSKGKYSASLTFTRSHRPTNSHTGEVT